jgi:hypothetical protein
VCPGPKQLRRATALTLCHPDRSEAEWKDLQCAPALSNCKGKPPHLICHPDRSEAERKDLQSASTLSNCKGKSPHYTLSS